MSQKDKYLILRDRMHMLSPAYWNCVNQTSSKTKELYGVNLKYSWMLFRPNGKIATFYLRKDWDRVAKYVADRMMQRKYFSKISRSVDRTGKEIMKLYAKIEKIELEKLSLKDLIVWSMKIKKVWTEHDSSNVLAWYVAGDEFKNLVRDKIDIPEEDYNALVTPTRRTLIREFDLNYWQSVLSVKKYPSRISLLAKGLSRDYGFIPFGYDGPEYWDETYFIKKIKKDLKIILDRVKHNIEKIKNEEKEKTANFKLLVKKYEFNSKQIELIYRLIALAEWTDERKRLDHKLNYLLGEIMKEVGGRCGVSYQEIKYLFVEEYKKLPAGIAFLKKEARFRINNNFIIEYTNGKGGVIKGASARRMMKEIERPKDISNIQGYVASMGTRKKYRGKVKIVLLPEQSSKIKKGEFLVAPMTTPDFIIAMKKAAGFVTDEGGVTCHAAIVAREMKKPCIIGTRIATQVLKDGDLVEMDTEKGVIKVIKKLSV